MLVINASPRNDGGNPDPVSSQGKKPELARAIELQGWCYRAVAIGVGLMRSGSLKRGDDSLPGPRRK